jgi:putative addiction module component (TIGR02574 family)
MVETALLERIKKMSVEDRIRIVDEIWDSISPPVERLELTHVQKAELDRRVKAHRGHAKTFDTWETVRARLERKT